MERADQVLALRRVDPGFAAHGTVHLRQKRGRHLHKPHAPAQHGGGKACKIADHAATKRDNHVAAFDLLFQQPFDRAGKLLPPLGGLTGRQGQGDDLNPLGGHAGAEGVKVLGRHVFIGQNGHPGARQKRRDPAPRLRQKPLSDLDFIAAIAQGDVNRLRILGGHVLSNTSGRCATAWATRAAMSWTEMSGEAGTSRSAC